MPTFVVVLGLAAVAGASAEELLHGAAGRHAVALHQGDHAAGRVRGGRVRGVGCRRTPSACELDTLKNCRVHIVQFEAPDVFHASGSDSLLAHMR